ncbi:MAG: hypothetical protein ACLFPY_04935 [Desulfonatronovibrio sp.]
MSILSSRDENDLSLAAAFFARSGSDKPITWTEVLRAGLDSLTEKPMPGEFPGPAKPDEEDIQIEAATDEPPGPEQESRESLAGAADSGFSPATEQETDFPSSAAEPGEDESLDNAAREEEFEEPEEMADFDIENEARTRSMADILYGQEEYAKALDIYQELWRNSLPGDDLRELEGMIARTKKALSEDKQNQDENSENEEDKRAGSKKKDTSEAVDFLMTLADRLEAKST